MPQQGRLPHMLFVSHTVVDIKPPLNIHKAATVVGQLHRYLQQHAFIPGEKFTGELAVIEVAVNGAIRFELAGSSMGAFTLDGIQPSIRLSLPVGLLNYSGTLKVQEVFEAIPGTAIEDGGNVQNMLLNILMLIKTLSTCYPEFNKDNFHLTVASSCDPFRRLEKSLGNEFQERVMLFPLGLDDRHAILLPYERQGQRGTLAITSEPKLTSGVLRNLLAENVQFAKNFSAATCFISSDPLFDLLPSHAMLPYATIINASSAFRALVALHSYNTCTLLPMNDAEVGEVCKLMLSRACGTELAETQAPRFPSPLSLKGNEIDPEMLHILDASLDTFARYNPPYRKAQGLAFACPISFGREGGLLIGTNARVVACFSSILSEQGEKQLFNEYGFHYEEKIHETGAGDSVAAIIALFNTVSPDALFAHLLEGQETRNKELQYLISLILVSTLGRLMGNILIRTTKTNITGVNPEALLRMINDAAFESVKLARRLLRLLPNPTYGVIEKWGIQFAVWTPRQIVFGPVTIGADHF